MVMDPMDKKEVWFMALLIVGAFSVSLALDYSRLSWYTVGAWHTIVFAIIMLLVLGNSKKKDRL